MGGAVSSGRDNDELIDNLMDADYIRTKQTERVFRTVDRGDYCLPDHRSVAYKDGAWKQGLLHMSAPCIYTKVMEAFELKPGQSFLNLGSGTGYFSTMVGLILGHKGMNHGVEYHESVVIYARERLQYFLRNCGSLDEFDFCSPEFIIGNCLKLAPPSRLYDRVYCGAGCPQEVFSHVKYLIKVGGIAVLPCRDRLLKVRRTDDDEWSEECLLSVAFASMLVPAATDAIIELPTPQVHTLKVQCRSYIRSILREKIHRAVPEPPLRRKAEKRTSRTRNVIEEGGIRWFQLFRDDNDHQDSDSSDDYSPAQRRRVLGPPRRGDLWDETGSSSNAVTYRDFGRDPDAALVRPNANSTRPLSPMHTLDQGPSQARPAYLEDDGEQPSTSRQNETQNQDSQESPQRKHEDTDEEEDEEEEEEEEEHEEDSDDDRRDGTTGCCGCSGRFMSRRKQRSHTHTQTEQEMLPMQHLPDSLVSSSSESEDEHHVAVEDEHSRFMRRRAALRSLIQVFDDRREPTYTEEETEDMERSRRQHEDYSVTCSQPQAPQAMK